MDLTTHVQYMVLSVWLQKTKFTT